MLQSIFRRRFHGFLFAACCIALFTLCGTPHAHAQKRKPQPAQPLQGITQPEQPEVNLANELFVVLRTKDTLELDNGTMIKRGMSVRLADSLMFKTRSAMMVVYGRLQGRHIVFRDAGTKFDNGWYGGYLYRMMRPAIQRPKTSTEKTGLYAVPPPMPRTWDVNAIIQRFRLKFSPQPVVVLDSILVGSTSENVLVDSAHYFAQFYINGQRIVHRFPTRGQGFLVERGSFLKTLKLDSLAMTASETEPFEIMYKSSSGREILMVGIKLVFPDPEVLRQEMALIVQAMRGKKREEIRQELYEFTRDAYGYIDEQTFNGFVGKHFKL